MSSKRNQRRRGCLHKMAHRNQAGAEIAAARLRAANPGAVFTPYRCARCGRFHVGHAPADVRKSMDERRQG